MESSINMSLAFPGADAWRESDRDGACIFPMQDTEDWNTFSQSYLLLLECRVGQLH
jgi:hypothetical protein